MKEASSDQEIIFFIALKMPKRKGQNTNLQNFILHWHKLETDQHIFLWIIVKK